MSDLVTIIVGLVGVYGFVAVVLVVGSLGESQEIVQAGVSSLKRAIPSADTTAPTSLVEEREPAPGIAA